VVTVDEVRSCAMALPRTEEHLIHDSIRFRIGRIVYLALSPDETVMAFAFPREERAALIAAEPERFFMPRPSDERFNWVRAWMSELSVEETRELITDAWRMCVPKKVAAAHLGD
jgi:hypothetical protein